MATIASVICPVLVGRDDLLAQAARRLSEAASGRGGLLLLAGEAGIGKSRLLRTLERRSGAEGFLAARGIAFPRDGDVAGGVLLDLARSLGRSPRVRDAGLALEARLTEREPVSAAAGIAPDGDAHRRRRILVLDVVDLLAGLPAEAGRPVLLAFEDLHWTDELSLEILAAAAGRLGELPLQVVATYRSDELYPSVPMREWRARLLAGRLAEEARLDRLDRAGTAQMITLIRGDGLPAPSDLVEAIHDRSDGVPLHVEELLAVLHDAPDGDGAGGPLVPDTLEGVILLRADRLSPVARTVADAAAVIGRSFDIDLLAAVLDMEPAELAEPVDALERAFVVTRSGGSTRLDFRHALIRDAIYGRVPIPRRRQLHGRVADATDGDPRFGPGFRSIHLDEAGRPDEAFEAALTAGREAALVSAHREARLLLERAVRTMPAELPGPARGTVLAELANELAAVDANVEADARYEEAERVLRAAGDVHAAVALAPRRVAVRHLLGDDLEARSARLDAGLVELDAVPQDPRTPAVRAALLAGLAAANMLDRRLEAAIAYGEAGRSIALVQRDEATELDAAATLGSCLTFAGRMDEGWSLLDDAVERSRAAGREAEAARGYRMLGTSASVLVEYARAEAVLRDGIAYAERVELWNHRHYMAAHLGHVLWATGRWDEAEAVAAHALSDGRGGITTRITALHVLGDIALGRGDLPRAGALFDEARALGERMGELQRLSPALWGLAEVALLGGDAAGAVRWCERGAEASARVDDAAYLFPFVLTGVRAYLALGDVAAAEAWAGRAGAPIARRAIPGTLPALDHAAGLIEVARGRTGVARRALDTALDAWQARGRWWEGTWALVDLAGLHARANRPAEAVARARDAEERAAAVGAAPIAEAAAAILRRVRSRAPADDPWSPLSPREAEVARAVSRGLTNAGIAEELGVSPRTVTAHVEHILAKLGAGRRAEIATWAASAARAGQGARRA